MNSTDDQPGSATETSPGPTDATTGTVPEAASSTGPETSAPDVDIAADGPPAPDAGPSAVPATDVGAKAETASGHVARPAVVSGGLSVLVATAAILFVAQEPAQVIAVAIALAGVVGLAVGIELWHWGRRMSGGVFVLAGVAGVAWALAWGFVETQSVHHRLVVMVAIVGLAVLPLGLAPVRWGSERSFLTVGTGTILAAVFLSGITELASATAMLAATAATIVAWDIGEQAVNVGEQVGRQARTVSVELVHGLASVIVGAVGVLVAIAFFSAGIGGLPLLGLTALLAAAIILASAMYL